MSKASHPWMLVLEQKIDALIRQKVDRSPIIFIGPLAEELPSSIQPDDVILFVDGGAKLKHGITNNNILAAGDADSVEAHLLDIVFPKQKDSSDLGLFLNALAKHNHDLALFGFSGSRLDHELFNLGEINQFLLQRSTKTNVHIDLNTNFFTAGQWSFKISGLFSVGSISPNKISISGDCKYKTKSSVDINPLSSFGLSNEAYGQIYISAAAPFFIYTQSLISLNEV